MIHSDVLLSLFQTPAVNATDIAENAARIAAIRDTAIAAIGLLTTLVTVLGGVLIAKVNKMSNTTAKIEAHVNSEKTASDGREALLNAENKLLREMLADKTVTASLLAQSMAVRDATRDAARRATELSSGTGQGHLLASAEPQKVQVVNAEEPQKVEIVATDPVPVAVIEKKEKPDA